ncbi:hypothetical protein YC2023_122145 [Brassica napus]
MAVRRYRSKGSLGLGSSFSALVVSRDGAQAQWLARARSSSWFKGWSSMPSQWPCALPPHLEPPLRVGFGWELALFFISCLLVQAMALAAPVSHYMGLLELLVVVREAIVCRLGSDYGVQRLRPVFLGSAPCTGD